MWSCACEKLFVTTARAPSLVQITANLVELDELDYKAELFSYSKSAVLHKRTLFYPKIAARIEAQRSLANNYIVSQLREEDLIFPEEAAYEVSRLSKTHRVSLFQEVLRCSCLEDTSFGYPDRHVEAVALHNRKPLDYSNPQVVLPRWRIPRVKPVFSSCTSTYIKFL